MLRDPVVVIVQLSEAPLLQNFKMSALQRSKAAFSRVMGTSQRRGFAASHGPQATWAEYRSGSKTLTEWVDGNRAQISFGFFVFYCSIAAWNLRPRAKGVETTATTATEIESEASETTSAPSA